MKKFSDYKKLDDLVHDLDLGIDHFNLDVLKEEVDLGIIKVNNRFVVQPMEGVDANLDGTPSELTLRRYERFARGGAGLIWFEATAVTKEGRTSRNQLFIRNDNVSAFKELVNKMNAWKTEEFGANYKQAYFLQLTHSGRFSKPNNVSEPVISYHNPYLNEKLPIDPCYEVITDEYLEELEQKYEDAAVLAYEAGFHGVDVKCCHRYLISELTSAYNRDGLYGGDFSNRIRFLINVVKRIKNRLGDKIAVAVRLNIYDGIPYPFGFGVDKDDHTKPDFSEPIKLIEIIKDLGVKVINITMGSPYYYPHVNRPFDTGGYLPPEDPADGVRRLLQGAEVIQKTFPDLIIVGTGYSWLRQYAPQIAAGLVHKKSISMIGFGRASYANPNLARDIIEKNEFNLKRTCITCSKCSDLKKLSLKCGCVVRDIEVYLPIYQEAFKKGRI
ncbi:MAG: NADH-flavin oxidoreductase [Haloplasmataceae bacterium]|jgi:2,4-dienoyl-CoA reductase-like NADH-dependent reductase (Old Yellow Enzyme family)|nr:NADH-flavin oxidoreductase [Haloplasmataceae bacterium]